MAVSVGANGLLPALDKAAAASIVNQPGSPLGSGPRLWPIPWEGAAGRHKAAGGQVVTAVWVDFIIPNSPLYLIRTSGLTLCGFNSGIS